MKTQRREPLPFGHMAPEEQVVIGFHLKEAKRAGGVNVHTFPAHAGS